MNEALAQALASIISYLGATPILLFFAVMGLGPWGATVWINYRRDRRDAQIVELFKKQMEDSAKRYENNVQLVKNYEGLTTAIQKIIENQQDLVILVTSTMQTLVDHIKSNLFCPLVKQATRPPRIEGERQ